MIPLVRNEPIKLFVIKKGRYYAGATSRFCLAVTGPTIREVQVRMLALVITTFRSLDLELPGETILETPPDLLEPFQHPEARVFELSVREMPETPATLELFPPRSVSIKRGTAVDGNPENPMWRILSTLSAWEEVSTSRKSMLGKAA